MIGVISINKYSVHMNYGAALHSFAFQKILDKQGIDNVLIDYYPKFMEGYNLKYPVLSAKTLRDFVRWTWDFKANLEKYHKFQNFFNRYCRFTEEKFSKENLNSALLDKLGIDTFVCESDVIWKPATTQGIDPGYFLHFCAAEKAKKISYAASVGLNMTNSEKHLAMNYLKDFDSISVREKDSVEFIKGLIKDRMKVHWVIDPTVLLHREDYQFLLTPPPEKKYLLVYNCTRNNRKMLRIAENTARKMGLEMVEISAFRLNNLIFNHKIKTNIGIEEFLGYFANADFVMCNAFHGSCFSVLFEKPFYLFQREQHDYRMKSLISPLGLNNIYISHDMSSSIESLPLPDINYQYVNNKLEEYRSASINYLQKALGFQ